MLYWRACALIILAVTAVLLATCFIPPGAAEGSPPLVILEPRDNLRTNNTPLVVTGITAPNATVNVSVEKTYDHLRQSYTC